MSRPHKIKITIRLDADIIAHYQSEATKTKKSQHPCGYQSLINEVLRECMEDEIATYKRNAERIARNSCIARKHPSTDFTPGAPARKFRSAGDTPKARSLHGFTCEID